MAAQRYVTYFSTPEGRFCISKWPCNALFIIYYYNIPVIFKWNKMIIQILSTQGKIIYLVDHINHCFGLIHCSHPDVIYQTKFHSRHILQGKSLCVFQQYPVSPPIKLLKNKKERQKYFSLFILLIAITTSKNTCTRIQNNTLVIKKDRREKEIK